MVFGFQPFNGSRRDRQLEVLDENGADLRSNFQPAYTVLMLSFDLAMMYNYTSLLRPRILGTIGPLEVFVNSCFRWLKTALVLAT
ncbi:hypothetical protein KXD40_000900 [Peronospora effusa]|uniref:Uncharacterized protein n=1 Tax=Peronospora effusa TaxID=542832 RepID=A0A3M6VBH7_9STRA|nr:hypothetical protein DD238_006633 [Peronospora effusa]RQM13051.1 hypothetical protein DD237_006934 [Peronospora effusa]UIZ21404.1 hypothetical protein KXD40_000900 [Peronospora effusa]